MGVRNILTDLFHRNGLTNKERERLEKYDVILQQNGQVYLEWETSDNLIHTNGFDEIFGYNIEGMEKTNLLTFIHKDDEKEAKMWMGKLVTSTQPVEIKCRLQTPLRGFSWVKFLMVTVGDKCFGFLSCIDEEQAREDLLMEEVRQAQSDSRQKSVFLSRISHEIRTPMNAIVGMTNIAQMSMENPTRLKDCLGKISTSAGYLLSLMNDLLETSKMEHEGVKLVEETFPMVIFIENIKAVIGVQAEKKQISFQVDNQLDNPGFFVGDSLRLNQIIINLLTNAVKFTDKGGSVIFGIRLLEQVEEKAKLVFTVKDNGKGIEEEFLPHIFEAFEQESRAVSVKYGGTGLGLSITKNIVTIMGGDIKVTSKVNQGTEFVVTVPFRVASKGEQKKYLLAAKDEKAREERTAENTVKTVKKEVVPQKKSPQRKIQKRARGNYQGLTFLLADDNELNNEIAQVMIEMHRGKVECVTDGARAVEKIKNAKEGAYSAVLMDISMPVMDGIQATKEIRGIGNEWTMNLPIIAVSANVFHEDKQQALDSGMDAHISKPYEPKELYAILDRFV